MSTQTTTRHAIDRLDEASSFRQALDIMRDAIDHEADLLDDGDTERHGADWDLRRAETIYRDAYERRLQEAQDALRRETVQALDVAGLDDYADALETGDYHGHLAF